MHINHCAIDHDSEAINAIKALALPVALYGNGRMADLEEQTLRKYNIEVACRIIDGTPAGDGDKIKSAAAIENTYSAYVLVLANGSAITKVLTDGGMEALKAKFPKAVHICYLNSIFGFEQISEAFYRTNETHIKGLYESLGDDKSRESLVAYLNSQISRDRRYLLPHVESPQYFSVPLMKIRNDEVFVDCGAYDGDTLRDFLCTVHGRYRRVIALEPDDVSRGVLQKYVIEQKLKNIEIIPVGAYDSRTQLRFSSSGDNSTFAENGDVIVKTDTIDAITGGEATIIKMDIEGGEMKALLGAEKTIRRCRPNLMICVYHKPTDLIDVPSFIKSVYPDYRFFFRVHRAALVDAVLYATVR